MIYGILISEAETGGAIQCGGCGKKADEGFNLNTAIEEEFRFLEMLFMDIINATVNRCCVDRFEKECSKRGLGFELTSRAPDEIMEAFLDGIHNIPENLLKKLSPDHEFYYVKTKDGVSIWGYLFDYTDTSFDFQNCRKLDRVTNNWERTGDNGDAYFHVSISTAAIESIEPAPYIKKDDSDYGFKPFVGDK